MEKFFEGVSIASSALHWWMFLSRPRQYFHAVLVLLFEATAKIGGALATETIVLWSSICHTGRLVIFRPQLLRRCQQITQRLGPARVSFEAIHCIDVSDIARGALSLRISSRLKKVLLLNFRTLFIFQVYAIWVALNFYSARWRSLQLPWSIW